MITNKLLKIGFLTPLLVIVINTVAFCNGDQQDKLWYKHAAEYIKADEIMIQNAIEKKETFLEDYDLRDVATLKLINAPSPTISVLEKLLKSKNAQDRKVALVNIMVRNIYSENLFKTILGGYDTNDDFFIRFYRYRCFKFLGKDKIRHFEDKFLILLSLENNGSIIISAMPTLIEIEPSKVIPFFVQYFKSSDRGLRLASYVYLKRMGEGYLNDVKSILEKENAVEALNFIKEAESGKKPSQRNEKEK
ncbi:MAG: hypothetical protein FD156_1104 [Nitrospirae bacterium]|nr:MAG: hypothetical protein FD156_1104 [Nitrospirota bacterium]